MRRVRRREMEDSDLDLAPMLSMIVSLIPVLLLSFSFFHFGVVEAVLPQASRQKPKADARAWKIELTMKKAHGLELHAKEGGRSVYRKSLPAKNGRYDLQGLHGEAVGLRKRMDTDVKVELRTAEDVPYEDVMKVMDQVRKKDGEWLFPEVVFADIFEG